MTGGYLSTTYKKGPQKNMWPTKMIISAKNQRVREYGHEKYHHQDCYTSIRDRKKMVQEGKMPHHYPQNGWSCFVLNSLALQYVLYTCSWAIATWGWKHFDCFFLQRSTDSNAGRLFKQLNIKNIQGARQIHFHYIVNFDWNMVLHVTPIQWLKPLKTLMCYTLYSAHPVFHCLNMAKIASELTEHPRV